MTHTGLRRGSLLECGDLKPILPFLGGRSDAALYNVCVKNVSIMHFQF